ncbi:MAG: phosphotransferase [Actinomycetes bacterium]
MAKRYTGADAADRQARESACLRALAGMLPVPEVVDERPGALRTRRPAGVGGKDLLAVGQARYVLQLAGRLLREVQAVDASGLDLPGEGPVLVHGDFGPQHLVVDGERVTGLVDWDHARRGHAVEDLAWAEWFIRMYHPDAVPHLDALFEGYGERPCWTVRRAAMLEACARRERRAESPAAADMWQARAEVTKTWAEAA